MNILSQCTDIVRGTLSSYVCGQCQEAGEPQENHLRHTPRTCYTQETTACEQVPSELNKKKCEHTLTEASHAASRGSVQKTKIGRFKTKLLKLSKRSVREMKGILSLAAAATTADISSCYFIRD